MPGSSTPYPSQCENSDERDASTLHKAMGCPWPLGPSGSRHCVCSNLSCKKSLFQEVPVDPSNIFHPIIFLHIFSRNYRTSAFSEIKTELLLYTEGT